MKIKIRFLLPMLVEFFLLFLTFVICTIKHDFLFWCSYGLTSIIVSTVCLGIVQKKVMTELNIYFLSFWLFQFGVPVIYVFRENYNNFYINLFTNEVLNSAAVFSVLSIIITSIGLIIGFQICQNNNRTDRKASKLSNVICNNKVIVCSAAFYLFIISALVVLPITGYAAFRQLLNNGYTIASRNVMTQNGLLKFFQEFFYSSGILLIVFDTKKFRRRLVIILYIIASVIMMLLADRAQGLVSLFVFFYYEFVLKNEKKTVKKSALSRLGFVVIGIVSVVVLEFIAAARQGKDGFTSILNGSILLNFVQELGFNFTSICFMMELIPYVSPFRYGSTYIASLIKLIPSSFDILGLFNNDFFTSGEMWLYNFNHNNGRSFLDFGVGYSLNAEAYFNFSWFGLILLFVLGIIVALLFGKKNDNNWSTYVHLVLLLDLLLLPRRQFFTLLKSVEYGILFMAIYLLFFISIKNGGTKK